MALVASVNPFSPFTEPGPRPSRDYSFRFPDARDGAMSAHRGTSSVNDIPSWNNLPQYHHQQQSNTHQHHQHHHQHHPSAHQTTHHHQLPPSSSWPPADLMGLPANSSVHSNSLPSSTSRSTGFSPHYVYSYASEASLSQYSASSLEYADGVSVGNASPGVLYTLPPDFDARSEGSPRVKIEPNEDSSRASAAPISSFVIEEGSAEHSYSPMLGAAIESDLQVPLRATQATKEMKKMMTIFRLDPFAIQGGTPQPKAEPRPLSAPGQVFEWQLPYGEEEELGQQQPPTSASPSPSPEREPVEPSWQQQYQHQQQQQQQQEMGFGYPLSQALSSYGGAEVDSYARTSRQDPLGTHRTLAHAAASTRSGDYGGLQLPIAPRFGSWDAHGRPGSSSAGSRPTTAGTYSDTLEDTDDFFQAAVASSEHPRSLRRHDNQHGYAHGHNSGYYS